MDISTCNVLTFFTGDDDIWKGWQNLDPYMSRLDLRYLGHKVAVLTQVPESASISFEMGKIMCS